MYWFRESLLLFLPWVGWFVLWSAGGYWLTCALFDLRDEEYPLIGVSVGLALYLWLVNVAGRWLSPAGAFAWPAVALFLSGAAAVWRRKRSFMLRQLFRAWPQFVAVLVLTLIFVQIGRGLGLYDEHKNLSLISTMALGNIPPRNYLSPARTLMYHYGFQLLGASMMRWGNLFPWSAFDISKALVWAYGILLMWLLTKRHLPHRLGQTVAVGGFVFATGTRYLLLFLPPALVRAWDARVPLAGVTSDVAGSLSEALTRGWAVHGGPPLPPPVAFLNGIVPPYVLSHAGPGTLSLVMFLLVWLLAGRSLSRWGGGVLTALVSFWALTWETSYALFMVGVAFVFAWYVWKKPAWKHFLPFAAASFASVPVVLWQGGTLSVWFSEKIMSRAAPLSSSPVTLSQSGAFSLRWPPAIRSAHFAPLTLTSLPTLAVALAELGPLVFFVFLLVRWGWRQLHRGNWYYPLLEAGAAVGFVFPIFVSYSSDRDITRLTAYAWHVWLFLLLFILWELPRRWKGAALLAVGMMMAGGVVVGGTLMTAMQRPIIARELDGLDARIARDVWGRFPQEARVFDPRFWRAVTVTGMFTRAGSWVGRPYPEWERLYEQPSLEALLAAGYRFVYVDETWWRALSPQIRQELESPCVQVVSEAWDDSGDLFRRLLDISACEAAGP